MNEKPVITSKIKIEAPHCSARTPSGRRCRMAISDPESGLCFRHAALRLEELKRIETGDFSTQLVCGIDEFRSAEDINHVLGELYKLLAADKITPRRGAVMAYTCSLLLRTLPAIEHELNPPDEEQQIIFDLPRPKRDDYPEDPERAMYKNMAERYGPALPPQTQSLSSQPWSKPNDPRRLTFERG